MSPQPILEQWFDLQAQAHGIACWLNCYLREFALPRGQADLDYRGRDRPVGLAPGGGALVRLRFAQAGYALIVRATRVSRLGRCEFAGPPYVKCPGRPWRSVDAIALVHFLLERLAPECGFNEELLAQSTGSVAMTRRLLQAAASAPPTGDAMLDAEQSMIWGHALHPTPKSREGVDMEAAVACSPEARARMPLYWFRIDPRLWLARGHDVRGVLARLSGADDLYPCHPWEAAKVLANPALQRARAHGLIEPLGPLGESLAPTSSVRTLHHPDIGYFLKLSVSVRLTNCVRKNAWYELESAVALSRLLAGPWARVREDAPGFGVLDEPAATTLDFSAIEGADADDVRALHESFGILYREDFSPDTRATKAPQVAGALFAFDAHGESVIQARLRERTRREGGRYTTAALAWFDAYARLLLGGVWCAFFRHGIVLEPHLQNTLVGFEDGLPSQVWVRDLEGTKLVAEHWPASLLDTLSLRARQSVLYPRELGWKRVAYCALINNLAEAIFHLAAGDPALEDRLWQTIARIASDWQRRFGREPVLQALLDGAPIPSKNNLRTRLFRRADRDSDYTWLPHPLAQRLTAEAAA